MSVYYEKIKEKQKEKQIEKHRESEKEPITDRNWNKSRQRSMMKLSMILINMKTISLTDRFAQMI